MFMAERFHITLQMYKTGGDVLIFHCDQIKETFTTQGTLVLIVTEDFFNTCDQSGHSDVWKRLS